MIPVQILHFLILSFIVDILFDNHIIDLSCVLSNMYFDKERDHFVAFFVSVNKPE